MASCRLNEIEQLSFIVRKAASPACIVHTARTGSGDEKEPAATRRSHFEVLPRESATDLKVVEVSTLSLYRSTHLVLFHFQAASHPRTRAHPNLQPRSSSSSVALSVTSAGCFAIII